MVVKITEIMSASYRHILGLLGIAAIAVGFWGWLGWCAGIIVAGLPFAGFYVAGQAIEVMRYMPKE